MINATTRAFFVFPHNLARFFAWQGLTPDVNLGMAFAYAKHSVPKPVQHRVR